jgi:hypothetical protein
MIRQKFRTSIFLFDIISRWPIKENLRLLFVVIKTAINIEFYRRKKREKLKTNSIEFQKGAFESSFFIYVKNGREVSEERNCQRK